MAAGPTGPKLSITIDESQSWLTINAIDKPIAYEIVDILGNTALKGKTSSKIDIHNLSNGSYFLRCEDNNATVLQFVRRK
jgi:hypothetical protein